MIQRIVSSTTREGIATMSKALTSSLVLVLLGMLTTGCLGGEREVSGSNTSRTGELQEEQEEAPKTPPPPTRRGELQEEQEEASEEQEEASNEPAPAAGQPVCGLFRGGLSEADNMIASPNPPESIEDTDEACIAYCDQSSPEPGDLCIKGGRILFAYRSQPCNENEACEYGHPCEEEPPMDPWEPPSATPGHPCEEEPPVPEQGQGSACFGDWKPALLDFPEDTQSCDGPGFVRWSCKQNLWVGVVSCGNGAVRLYLSESEQGPFLPALDTAGHGQDHCELLVPGFTLGNEDDIASGSCSSCSTGANIGLKGVPGYARSKLGEPFVYVPETSGWSYQTSRLSCGCSLGEPSATP